MKKLLIIVVAVVLLSSVLLIPNYAKGNNQQNKISEELQMHIDQGEEEIPVYIWFEDLDLDAINAEAEKALGYTQKDIQKVEDSIPSFNSNLNESDPEYDTELLAYTEQTRIQRAEVLEMQNYLIEKQREFARVAYENYNAENLQRIKLEAKQIVYVSRFTPVIIASVLSSDIVQLQENEAVLWLGYKQTSEPMELFSNALPAVDAKYVRDTLGYDGYNVKVGMFDAGQIKSTVTELSSTSITKLDSSYAPLSAHATSVAMVLSGSNGFAPNVHLYSHSNTTTIEQGLEDLINCNVSVINMSVGYERPVIENYYTDFEKWVDHIANSHNVSMVIPAGNDGMNLQIIQPGLSYNVNTVGGTNTKQTLSISDDVLFNESRTGNGGTSGCAKPDFLAPAFYNNIYNDSWQYMLNGGTSLAAPAVTGIIAQMIECRPTIASKPAVIKAVLTSSTTRKLPLNSGGTSTEAWADTITAQQGAGEVNAKKAIAILSNNHYASGTMSSTTITKTFPVTSSDQYIRYSVAWIRGNVANCSSQNATAGVAANLKLRLFDTNNTALFTSNIPTSSVELAHISINGVYGTYKAKIYRVDAGTNSFKYAVAWR